MITLHCSACNGNGRRTCRLPGFAFDGPCASCSGTGVYCPQSQLDRVRGGIQALLKLATLEGDVARFGLERALEVVEAVEASGVPESEVLQ